MTKSARIEAGVALHNEKATESNQTGLKRIKPIDEKVKSQIGQVDMVMQNCTKLTLLLPPLEVE